VFPSFLRIPGWRRAACVGRRKSSFGTPQARGRKFQEIQFEEKISENFFAGCRVQSPSLCSERNFFTINTLLLFIRGEFGIDFQAARGHAAARENILRNSGVVRAHICIER
jgi:hypothetical protein